MWRVTVYVHQAWKLGPTFSLILDSFDVAAWYHQNVAVILIPEPTRVLSFELRGAGAVRSISGVILCGQSESQTGCHHFVWRKQHSDTSGKSGGVRAVSRETFPWQTRILSKRMHTRTQINKTADNLCEQTGRKTKSYPHTHTHTKDLTVGMIAGSRQHFHTSLSSSFFLRWQGPMGESREGQEREMLSVCMCVSMSLRCATIKEYHNILFVKVIIFILYPE